MNRSFLRISSPASPSRNFGFLGWIALGVGLGIAGFTLLEPTRGAARRAMLRDKASSRLRHLGEGTRNQFLHARGRLQGALHDARALLSEGKVSDAEERVRSVRGVKGDLDRDVHDDVGSVSSLQ